MGITGRWPQVVNIWEIPGGWDGWFGKVDRLGLKRSSNRTLERVVEAGVRVPVGWVRPAARCRARLPDHGESLAADDVRGSLFVHELSEVRPGTALEYLAAVREERAPLMAEYGHELVGLYEVMMNDYEVCTVWATERRGPRAGWPRRATSPAVSSGARASRR